MRNTEHEILFKLGYDHGKQIAQSNVEKVFALYTRDEKGITWIGNQDYAVLKLQNPLGNTYGWFTVVPRSADYVGIDVSLAGYSLDVESGETISVDQRCHLKGFRGDKVIHDCNMTPGASGSPIYQVVSENEAILVALNASQRVGMGEIIEDDFLEVEKYNES